MRAQLFTLLLFAYLTSQSTCQFQGLFGEGRLRRILHQPLFPDSSAPPQLPQSPPLPQPSPVSPDFPDPEQPFFPEVPTGPVPDQAYQPQPVSANGTAVPSPVVVTQGQQQTTPVKKVAIAISVGIVTLGMLSGLAFYLYKHKVKRADDSQKLVGGNSQRTNEESRLPPSTFLYIGTVGPSAQRLMTENNGANGSPYRKLNSVKISDRYRPSPDLQPLPPLSKPPPPPSINSPPPMSSSDEESHDTAFYTPQGSSVSNEEGSYEPSSRQSHPGNNTSLVTQSSVPHSKRTSPKSRLSAPSSDKRHVIIPSIKQPGAPTSPPQLSRTNLESLSHPSQMQLVKSDIPYAPKRPKFSAPPPPPDLARLQLISSQGQEIAKAPFPPPPPPPPPLPPLRSVPRKMSAPVQEGHSAASPQRKKGQQSRSPTPNMVTNPAFEKVGAEVEVNKCSSSTERHDADDIDGSKPKLKPLHWDKVRATSDRATVWDRLKSSSFQ